MTTKDWILLVIPIVANGVLVFIFQKVISRKIERFNKKQALKDEAIILFWRKLQELNSTFIQVNISVNRDPKTINTEIQRIYDKIFEIIEYYDTNNYDLKDIQKDYEKMISSWHDFATKVEKNKNLELTNEIKIELGEKLQNVKERNQNLITSIRNAY